MILKTENGILTLAADSCGAEMISLKKDGKEYLWGADPAYWPEHAPVLFPFVGRVRDGVYRHNGREYRMPIHGFAKGMEFRPETTPDGALKFALTDTEETRENYPFPFLFTVLYRLRENSVEVHFAVENTGNEDLFFMVGGHPGFLCPPPSFPGAARSECGISFLKDGQPLDVLRSTPVTDAGLAAPAGVSPLLYSQENGRIIPDAQLFSHDALIAENYDCDEVDLLDPEGRPYLSVRFDAPLVGVWSVAGTEAPYICIEPWWGRCDREGFSGELKDREWEQSLAPGERFDRYFTITVF